MEYQESSTNDLISDKLNYTMQKSSNTLHKKAIVLVKGLKDQLGKQSEGLDGVKNYIKNIIGLIDVLFNKISNLNNYKEDFEIEEDIRNFEALIFTLAVCIKRLPFNLLRNEKIIHKLISTIERSVKVSSIVPKRVELKKYAFIIAEKLIISRSEAELKDEKDLVVQFFSNLFFSFLDSSSGLEELQKCLVKSFSKILKVEGMVNNLKMTLIQEIKTYMMLKIRGLNVGKDDQGNTLKNTVEYEGRVKSLTTSEGEAILKFLCSVIQFLPFEIVNDLILELASLILNTENKHILLNSLLCFEVSFNTKSFAVETSEKIVKMLLNKDFLIYSNDEEKDEKKVSSTNQQNKIDINVSLTISYMKSITSVLNNLSRFNILLAVKHMNSVLSMLGEFLTSGDDFLRISVFNLLQNLFNNLLSRKNVNILFKGMLKKKNDMEIDPNELTLDINITKQGDEDEVVNMLNSLSLNLLYLTSDRFEDLKLGFNLLHNFLEKINIQPEYIGSVEDKNIINAKIENLVLNILTKLSEDEKLQKSQTFKVFLGKIFNFVQSSVILRLFPLQILDFDICSDDYTDDSKVWIISYIDKFMRNDNIQNLKQYFDSFYLIIEDLEKVLMKLKESRIVIPGMEIEEEDDEKFITNRNESEHFRNIKIKRYELILGQIYSLMIRYTHYNPNFDLYIKEILKKFEAIIKTYNKEPKNSIMIPNIKEIIFKVLTKMINVGFKVNDMNSLTVIKNDGKTFFSKCLNMILNGKLSKSEMSDSFNLVTSFCRIMNENFLYKIICDMIEKFDKSVQSFFIVNESSSNKAKMNESINLSGDEMKVDTKDKKTKNKEMSLLSFRIDVINFILQNIKISDDPNNSAYQNIFTLLNSFFEKFFFNDKISCPQIKKKLIDLFMIMLNKIKEPEKIIAVFTKFVNEYKGLDNLSAKHKAKLFNFIVDILIKKFENQTNLDFAESFSQLHILIEIVTLTKDMNKKVRNLAYDMIGRLTDFMSETNLFNQWIKMILAIMASHSTYLKSASINALARIFWQKRNCGEESIQKFLLDTSNVILLLLRDNNKEITKSIFLFIRVVLYLNKNLFASSSHSFIATVIKAIFEDSNEDIKKEFKVKIRNLLKNLVIKFSYEEIRNLVPTSVQTLLAYINKHIVKKLKTMTKEEEKVYGDANLDHSVMLDNDENLLDEEEEYIEKEFKKLEKRKNEIEKFLEKLDRLNLEEDDPELIKKRNQSEKPKNEKLDKIEQLFNKDNIELDNFFYVNPYAVTKQDEKKNEAILEEKDKDVFYDKKKGKLIIKDNPVTLRDSRATKRLEPKIEEKDFDLPIDRNKFLKMKRVQNVAKDTFDDEESDEEMKNPKKKRKLNEREEKNVRGKRESHIVKFSGDEYKNKAGKGDKLVTGKYEPFAYIQLNPKTTSHRRRTEAVNLFKGIMHPEKKNK